MSLFLLTFFFIYGGTHLYFFLKVKAALSLGTLSALCLALFMLLMVFAPVLVRILEKQGMEASARLTAIQVTSGWDSSFSLFLLHWP
ncbi:MAG: hypothetical protein ABSG48_08840 [Geobacteraceae bacterium]